MRVSLRLTTSLILALALLCVLLAAVAGAFAPAAAAASPDAARIDEFLTAHDSPMTGSGATFVAEGVEHGVDPAFLVAIAGAESSFGQLLYSENGDECTYNAFNWFFGPTWPQSDFGSWDEAIARVAQGLAGDLYHGAGLYSVDAIAPRYCPDGTSNWITNVTYFMMQLGADPADTRLAPSTDLPPSTQAGLLALEGAIELSDRARVVGSDVDARFTITNSGGQPVTLEGIRLAIRGPLDVVADLVSDQPFTLAPGQPLEVSASWPLDSVGVWRGWIEVTQDGEPSLVGKKQAFAFRVSLPRDLLVRRWILAEATLSPAQ